MFHISRRKLLKLAGVAPTPLAFSSVSTGSAAAAAVQYTLRHVVCGAASEGDARAATVVVHRTAEVQHAASRAVDGHRHAATRGDRSPVDDAGTVDDVG